MASNGISLSEAVEFCTRSSDEENSVADEEDNVAGVDLDNTIFGVQGDKLTDNESEELTSDEELSDVDVSENFGNVNRQFHRRRNVYAVSSIDTSLDESNYDLIDMNNVGIEEIEVPLEKRGKNVTKKITWTTAKPIQNVRQGPQNIIPNAPGVKPEFRQNTDPHDAWCTFIDDDIIQIMVTYTNQSINESIARSNQQKKDSKLCHHFDTNFREMKAFIGLWYIRGLLNWTFHDITTVYSREYGNKIFNATMSIKRFRFLCANIRFDDINTREEHFQHDRAAAIRLLFETFMSNCKKVMNPDGYLSLDETLYPTRVGVAFRQYNKSKPAKYGLLFRSINSAEMPYTYSAVLYAGKPPGQPGEHYITGTDDIVKYLVTSLSDRVNTQGRNISCDRFYTSIELANWLLEKKMTIVGTINTNRKGVGEIKIMDERESQSTKVYWEKEKGLISMTSYVVNTKSSGKRNVLVLSTVNPILGVTKDDGKCKPAIIKFYDYTKGGTDIVDQKMGRYSVKPKSSKWTVAAFSYVLDVARVNATTLSILNHNGSPKTHSNESFLVGWKLAMSLIIPQLHHRNISANGLRKHTQNAIAELLGIKIERPPSSPGKRKRCRTCLDQIEGDDHKKKKDSLGKSVHRCMRCGESLCTAHFQKICPSCFQ